MTQKTNLLVFLVLSLLVHIVTAPKTDASEQYPAHQIPLRAYLETIGVKFDCYFTLESKVQNGLSNVGTTFVDSEPGEISWADFKASLQKALPTIKILSDPANPQVFHLVDESLLQKDYVLEKNVSLKYSGDLNGLVDRLRSKFLGRVDRSKFFSSSEHYRDFFTQVKFSRENASVRSILTDYLPLSKYRRLLWQSVTSEGTDGQRSLIQYSGYQSYGRLESIAYMQRVSMDRVPFSYGELAFQINAASTNSTVDAIAFIDGHMKTGQMLNVRWAMLYLGKHKIALGIPILIKYLDYQYAPSPVIEERYPALRALSNIGTASLNPALKGIQTETAIKRLELLCRVVIKVLGSDKGRQTIEASSAIMSASHRAAVLKALGRALEPGATVTIDAPMVK